VLRALHDECDGSGETADRLRQQPRSGAARARQAHCDERDGERSHGAEPELGIVERGQAGDGEEDPWTPRPRAVEMAHEQPRQDVWPAVAYGPEAEQIRWPVAVFERADLHVEARRDERQVQREGEQRGAHDPPQQPSRRRRRRSSARSR
jgi:hypothetical protein